MSGIGDIVDELQTISFGYACSRIRTAAINSKSLTASKPGRRPDGLTLRNISPLSVDTLLLCCTSGVVCQVKAPTVCSNEVELAPVNGDIGEQRTVRIRSQGSPAALRQPLDLQANQPEEGISVVRITQFVLTLVPAALAALCEISSTIAHLIADWLHQAPTRGRAIAGIYVDMLRPEAVRTVISVAVSDYFLATTLTAEILNSTLE